MNIFFTRKIILWAATCSLILGSSISAASGGGGDKFVEGVNYLPITPALVVNYGGAGKAKYIKAEMSLRVEDMHAASEVSHHMPAIRDALIMLISSMTDEQMSTGEGKELMRQEALIRVNETLEAQINGVVHEAPSNKAKHGDDHGADAEHGKADKAGKKATHAKTSHSSVSGPVADLLFDNLIVQK